MRITPKLIRRGLTILGLIGIPLTSFLSVKGYQKAEQAETKQEKIKCYIPAMVSGAITGTCIICNHRVSSKEIAALTATATYAVANRNKVEEILAANVDENPEEVKKVIREETVKQLPHKGQSVEWTGKGTLKVLEGYSGRLFYSTMEQVIYAEARLNEAFKNEEYVCMNDFYKWLGIQQTHFGDQWGWVPNDDWYPRWYEDNPICFENTLVDDEDGNPMLVIDLYTYPMEGWKEI